MTDNRRVIGVDVDDVLADFMGAFSVLANKRYGVPLGTRPVDWDWSNYKLTTEQIDQLWADCRATKNFWYELGKEEGTNSLPTAHSKDLLYYITNRFPTEGLAPEIQTAAFLHWHFTLAYPTVIVAANKGEIAKALGLTHFIDDRPKNCLDVLHMHQGCKVYIKTATHNTTFEHPKIERVDSFDDFYTRIA
jgi:uncharacterized protein